MTAIWRDETDQWVETTPLTRGYPCSECKILHYRTDYEYPHHLKYAVHSPIVYSLPPRERIWRAAMGRPQIYGRRKATRRQRTLRALRNAGLTAWIGITFVIASGLDLLLDHLP